MAELIIRPQGDTDWSNAIFLEATLPLSAQSAAAIGVAIGQNYEIGRIGETAEFSVSDVPDIYTVPTLNPSDDQIQVIFGSAPNGNGLPLTRRDVRFSTDEATWTEVQDVQPPHTLTGLSLGTLYFVQTRAVNANGPGPWSPTASALTGEPQGVPVINALVAGTQENDGDLPLMGSFSQTGQLLYVITTSATPPTPSQISAGQDQTGTPAPHSGSFDVTNAGTFTDTGLPLGLQGSYFAHACLANANGDSEIASTDAFTLDTLVPVLSNANANAISDTAATGSVSSNSASGTLYGGLVAAGGAAPSAAQLIAGSGGGLVAAVNAPAIQGSNSLNFTGLNASSDYVPYFVQANATGQTSTVIAGPQFQTQSTSGNDIAPFVGSAKLAAGDGSAGNYTTPSLPLGSGDVIIGVAWISGGGSNQRVLASLTANGNACTRIIRAKNARFVINTEWYVVSNPGASGTIAIDFQDDAGTPLNLDSDGGLMVTVFAGSGALAVLGSAGEDVSSLVAGNTIALALNTSAGGKVLALHAHFGNTGAEGLIDLPTDFTKVDHSFLEPGVEVACLTDANVAAQTPRTVNTGSSTQTSFFSAAAVISLETA